MQGHLNDEMPQVVVLGVDIRPSRIGGLIKGGTGLRITRRLAAKTALGAAIALAAMPGVASAACPAEPTTQPFTHLGDHDNYFLAPGGDFESAPHWSRYGNATVEPRSDSSGSAARLSHSSSLTSPAFCVDDERPHLRLAARALSTDGTLRVDAVAEDGSKTLLAKFSADDYMSWRVTRPVLLSAPLGIVAGEARQVRLRVTSQNGAWLADDVYVDPYTRG